MSYQALYRTYRPENFEDFSGQSHIVKSLKNAIKHNKIAHAYLFAGPRGTGKTSMAKVFAKAINCTSKNKPCGKCDSCLAIQSNAHPDIIEIDAASNNGVEEVRDLIEKVKYSPNSAEYKVYIIDEIHMMSTGAFNALLKTLEEPPSHIIFILATTEAHKIIPTILSRCQRFDFNKLSKKDIFEKLLEVVKKEKIKYDEDALLLISDLASGGMRDALTILEQTLAFSGGHINIKDVLDIYGLVSNEEKFNLLFNLLTKQAKSFSMIQDILSSSVDLSKLILNLSEIIKEVLFYEQTKKSVYLKSISINDADKLLESVSIKTLMNSIDILIDYYNNIKFTLSDDSFFELLCLKLFESGENKQTSEVENTIQRTTSKQVVKKNIKKEDNEVKQENIKDTVKEEIKQSIQKTTTKEISFTDKELFNIMVQKTTSIANKNLAVDKWKELDSYMTSAEFSKIVFFLKEGSPAVVADNAIIISFKEDLYLNEFKKEDNYFLLVKLLKSLFKKDILPLFVDVKKFDTLVTKFIKLKKENKLPNPEKIHLDSLSSSSDENLEYAKNLFGNLLEVEED